jgi:hypothetical protein
MRWYQWDWALGVPAGAVEAVIVEVRPTSVRESPGTTDPKTVTLAYPGEVGRTPAVR